MWQPRGGRCLRLPLAEIGAQRLVQPVAAGFGPALGFRIVPPPSVMAKPIPVAFEGKCWGKLAWTFAAMAGSARHARRLYFPPPGAYLAVLLPP